MADVRSLAIRGIRSFGPEECDEQRITFEKPLTLILGQNGCGKTTIIESLRYAITGQMPPGSRNECFVHDAKVSRSSEVLGQVKLKIVNPKDKQLEVSRTMKVTSFANKKTRFQTLDSFLSVIDENGTTKDISSKCANLDNVMHEELGVSKAILNSVIFCHQEDSNWPLDEGKKVKDRFDEIFDADKYSVCFDRLRKLRKENTMTIKLLEQEVAFLTEKKQELDKRKLEVVNTEARISEAEIKIAELAAELKPVDEKIAAIVQLQRSLHDFETKKDKITTRLEHCRTQEEELKKTIKTQFEGTIEDLQEQITNYSSTAKAKQKELEDSNRKIFYFNKEEEKIANERSNNEVKCSNLDLLESQNQEKIEKRKGMIAETAQIAELELTPIETVEDADKAFESVSEKIHVFKKELSDLKAQADAEEKEQQALVDACLVALSRHQQKISGKQGEIQAVTKQMAKLDKEINDVNESKVKLEAMEKKMEAAEEEYKQAGIDLNPEECQKEIDEDEKGRESLEQELEQLNDKITKLQKQATKLKEKEMIEESLKQKEKQFSVLKNKHKSAITELLGSMPEKDFTISVNKLECQIRNEVDAMKKKLKESRLEVTKLETERKYVRESLNERRSELTKAENKMYQACGAHPYETTLAKVSANLEKLQEEQSVLQSSMIVFAKYKRELKDNSCCPLCSRGFENENDVADLITQLTTEVINVPSKLEKVTEDLQRSSAKKDELLSMKTINEKITSLKETDIPKLETRLNDIDKQTSSLSEKVEELSMSLIEPEQKLQTAKQIQGDMPMLDRYTNEIKTAAKDLEAIQSQIGDVENDISLDDATAKQSDLRQKISTLRTRIKTAQKKLNAHNKKLQQVAEKKNKLKEQLLNLQRKVQEIVALQDKKKELEASIEKLKEEQKQLEDETAPLEADLKVKQDAKAEVIKKNRAAIDVKNTYIQKVISSFDKVKAVNNEIKQHKEKNIPLQKEKIKEANEKLNEKQRQLTDDRDALTKRINVLKDELAKQEIYKRDLEDNLKLRKAQNEIESGDKTLVELTESINGLNKESIAEKGPLIDQQTRLMKEKSTTQGELNMQKEYLKKSKNKLNKYMTTDVEKNYKEKFYELHVTKAIDKDIRDYCVALEKCLMEFHKEKMENINLIIREMWRKIYRGNDIDYIEIKTEGGMTTESERRKYDYRVVQCKRDVEIDMRGRCSAGQKVLACLIIRLALAETFSSRFGVLALDEPTTNLDHENISSLCAALSEIVRERMRQKNFMFIIITHDKEFIESLGNIDKVTHYYEVSRNEDGKSRVKKIRFT